MLEKHKDLIMKKSKTLLTTKEEEESTTIYFRYNTHSKTPLAKALKQIDCEYQSDNLVKNLFSTDSSSKSALVGSDVFKTMTFIF